MDQELMAHYGEGAESLLWVGIAANEWLGQELLERKDTFAVLGDLILRKKATFSPTWHAYYNLGGREFTPTVLGLNPTVFASGPLESHYYLAADQVTMKDAITVAYSMPPIAPNWH